MNCILCKSSEENHLELGEMKVFGEHRVHYFCLLLSSSLLTNGEEDEGILGFLPSDIIKESKRAIRLKCNYCEKNGASIGCCVAACKHSFHLNCGLKNGCLNQFTAEFKSYCHRHVEDSKEKCSADRICIICYSEMGKHDNIQSIFAPCCKSEWFHKNCLMKLADSAGYFFKCPKCNDVDTFTDECMKRGIFVPQRDAAWETEVNAYHELMERPDKCNADKCLSRDGRGSNKPYNELIICETCGSKCIHKNCWRRNVPYYCCYQIDIKTSAETIQQSTKNNGIVSNDPEIIAEIRKKRKRELQTDDEKIDEKRRKKLKFERLQEESSSQHKTIYVGDGNSKMNAARNDTKIKLDFPISKIRNGSFDKLLRCRPRVVLRPLSVESFKIPSKTVDNLSNSNRAVIPSNVDNKIVKNELKTSPFAIISSSPKRKGGKTFKNHMITSFFKPFQ